MEDMGDTVEISGEGAAKAVTNTSVDAEEKTNEENGEAVPAKDT